MVERRGSVYDPARDLFTNGVAEGMEGTADEAAVEDSPSPTPSAKRKRNSVDVERRLPDQKAGDDSQLQSAKRIKPSQGASSATKESSTLDASSLSSIKRVKKPISQQTPSTSALVARRSPPRRSEPEPLRSPSPPAHSPPRQRKRPGASSRVNQANVDLVKKRQEERERQDNEEARAEAAKRGVSDVVAQHYNAVPQRGREWRQTSSKIKGLRSFNNWIKSAVIQKFSTDEDHTPGSRVHGINGSAPLQKGLLVLDIGCGKGGDLQKWQSAPQRVDLYVGFDPADVSVAQARERFEEMKQRNRNPRFRKHLFDAHFFVRDGFGDWLGHVPIIREVGIDPTVGPDAQNGGQPRRGGFDIVTMMFCMHYAFESEAKARGMLKNVAGSLKKGGRFIGVIPNSDVITTQVRKYNDSEGLALPSELRSVMPPNGDEDDDWDPEGPIEIPNPRPVEEETSAANGDEPKEDGEIDNNCEWGNSIYRVKFPGRIPKDSVFQPYYGWKYFYFLEEAVEEVPEYVVPWEAFRYLASQYDLELQFRMPFNAIWEAEKDNPILGPLSERMNVRGHGKGPLLISKEELEAASELRATPPTLRVR